MMYYSSKFSTVVLVMPGCLRSVASVATMTEKSVPIVLVHDCAVYVSHLICPLLEGQDLKW